MTGHIRLLYIILPACFLLAACTAPILDKEEKFTCLIGDCMGLGYWRDIDVVPRYEMLQALLLAYERVPEWRPIAKRAAVMGTKFRVATAVMAQARGEYNGFHTVIISPNELSDHTVILASILGHEVSHAGSEKIHGPHTLIFFNNMTQKIATRKKRTHMYGLQ